MGVNKKPSTIPDNDTVRKKTVRGILGRVAMATPLRNGFPIASPAVPDAERALIEAELNKDED